METAPPLYIAGEDAYVPGKEGCVHVSGLLSVMRSSRGCRQ